MPVDSVVLVFLRGIQMRTVRTQRSPDTRSRKPKMPASHQHCTGSSRMVPVKAFTCGSFSMKSHTSTTWSADQTKSPLPVRSVFSAWSCMARNRAQPWNSSTHDGTRPATTSRQYQSAMPG